jgi:hypothetical protein
VDPDPESTRELASGGDHEHDYHALLWKDVAGDQGIPRSNDEEAATGVTNPLDRVAVGDWTGLVQCSLGRSSPQGASVESGPDREPAQPMSNLGLARNSSSQVARGRP